jgi:long-chain acyl-CoA synthetase
VITVPFLVQHFLEHSAARLPQKAALICDGQRWRYGEIDAMANRLAHGLMELGVKRGDRVVVYLPNTVEAVVSIFAILKASAVFVVINPATKRDKLHYMLNNCRASAVIASGTTGLEGIDTDGTGAVPSIRAVVMCDGEAARVAASKSRWVSFASLQRNYPAQRPRCANIDVDLACLIYTSGSTGEPKGVMSDHGNMAFASGSIIHLVQNTERDVVFSVLPLSFNYGLYQLLMTFRFGGTLVLEKSFAFPAAMLQAMEREGATGFPGVPMMYAMLVAMDLSEYDLSRLRYFTNTAAALPVNHIATLREKLPWVTLYSMYGLTETKRTLCLPPDELDRRPASVGIPIPGTEAWVQDDHGRRLGPHEIGELVVRGRHVMRGYWEAPELTAKRFRHGAIPGERIFHTGDLFRTDEAGFFYFVGRCDDIIKSRGEKVAPMEVEKVLYQLPGVIEAAVIGVPDAVLGQAVKVIIVSQDHALTEQRVRQHCKRQLEDYMMPKYVEFRTALPKTSTGKISKTELA